MKKSEIGKKNDNRETGPQCIKVLLQKGLDPIVTYSTRATVGHASFFRQNNLSEEREGKRKAWNFSTFSDALKTLIYISSTIYPNIKVGVHFTPILG